MVVRLGTGDAFDTVNATLATRNDPALGALAKGRGVRCSAWDGAR